VFGKHEKGAKVGYEVCFIIADLSIFSEFKLPNPERGD